MTRHRGPSPAGEGAGPPAGRAAVRGAEPTAVLNPPRGAQPGGRPGFNPRKLEQGGSWLLGETRPP